MPTGSTDMLVGSYCMPRLEGYKDFEIPPVGDEGDDGRGVGPILEGEEEDFLEEQETPEPDLLPEDQEEMKPEERRLPEVL